MPLDEAILGFSNQWYSYAIDSANELALESDLSIRAISAPAFLATKWEAFEHRGAGDVIMSHDLEDIVTLVAGRPEIVNELRAAPDDVREFVRARTQWLLDDGWAEEIIENAIHDARHVPGLRARVIERFRTLAGDRE